MNHDTEPDPTAGPTQPDPAELAHLPAERGPADETLTGTTQRGFRVVAGTDAEAVGWAVSSAIKDKMPGATLTISGEGMERADRWAVVARL